MAQLRSHTTCQLIKSHVSSKIEFVWRKLVSVAANHFYTKMWRRHWTEGIQSIMGFREFVELLTSMGSFTGDIRHVKANVPILGGHLIRTKAIMGYQHCPNSYRVSYPDTIYHHTNLDDQLTKWNFQVVSTQGFRVFWEDPPLLLAMTGSQLFSSSYPGICYWTLSGGVGKRPFLLPFRDMFRMGVRSKQSSMSNLLQNMSSKKTRMILSTCTVCTMLKWRARAKHHLRNKIQKDVDKRKIHLQTTRFSHLENVEWLIYHMPMYGNMNK